MNAEGPVGVLAQHFKKLGLTQDTLHVVHEQMPYKGDEGLAKLEEAIQSLPKLRLVIVDPASKLLRLLDSFDPGEVLLGIEKLEALADKYKLHLMFLVHAKKKETDDPGDAAMGSTSFRGGTDTNIFLRKQGSQRTISTEQRWGVAMEQTVLLQDPESLAIQLGSSVEDLEDACNVAKERKTDERTRKVISDSFCITPHPTQGELLAAVTGKNTTKLRIIKQMVENGEIVAEADGRAIRYRWVGIPVETLSGVAA